MKVCFLIADISGKGGTERVTSMIANGLAERGYEVGIISCKNGQKSFFTLNSDVHIYTLKGEDKNNKYKRKYSNYKKIWNIITNEKYDVIIAVDIYLYLYTFPLQIMKKCKCIAWEHFNYHFSSMKWSRIARTLSIKFANKVVVLGKNDLNNYLQKYKKANNITCIYNPVAFQKLKNKSISKHRVIAAGRLTEQKGFDLLIEAWNIIEKADNNSDWILDIWGEGQLKKQLSDQINQYHLKRIHLKGYANNLDKEYLESSIFVLSSRYEGFGLVLIEALACGLPCVSFNCPEGPSEIIDNEENGFLVENGNATQLAERLLQLMQSEELRNIFSSNAHKDLWRFDLREVLNQWERLLHSI